MTIRWRLLRTALGTSASPFWLSVGGIAWALVIAWVVNPSRHIDTAATFRYAGTLLQLMGVASVAWGLQETLGLVPEHIGIAGRVRRWLAEVATAFRPPKTHRLETGSGGLG